MKNLIITLVGFGLFSLSAVRSVPQTRSSDPVRPQGEKPKILYRNSYALLIGNSEYEDQSWRDLPGVKIDIPAVREALEKHTFKVEEAWNLTRREFLDRIDEFISAYGQNYENRLLIYYAGHGYTAVLSDSRKMGYLVMKDAPEMPPATEALRTSPSNLPQFRLRAISMDEINEKARAISSRHALFVFDSCFSGTVLYRDNIVTTPKEITSEELHPMRGFLTAGNELQSVQDDSPFRRSFVGGLAGEADANRDGLILISELLLFLRPDVDKKTRQKQTPVFGKLAPFDRGDMLFVLPDGKAQLYAKMPSTPSPAILEPELAKVETRPPPDDKVSASLDLTTALMVLDRALLAKDGSMQGQVEAIESLLARGYEFSNKDFSGILLRGARLPKGVFTKVRMHLADLSNADASGTNFSESGWRFANLDQAVFEKATLIDIYAPFVSAQKTNFKNANLSKTNFFCADLRGADFSNANLNGVSFAFADLRGAIFDGADLTGAYFEGAILDNATFTNAKVQNTDFSGAVADKFLLSPPQKVGACRHHPHTEWHVTIYDSGTRDSFAYTSIGLPTFAERSLPMCTSKPLDRFFNTAEDGIQYAIYVDGGALSKAGRRSLVSKRFFAYAGFLKSSLTIDRVLKGDDAERKSWDAYLRNAVQNRVTPVSNPYMNSDLMLLILLQAGELKENDVDWQEQAEVHHRFEERIAENRAGGFASYSMWPSIFPPGVTFDDLPADKGELYRAWTRARVSKAPRQVTAKFSVELKGNESKELLIVPLDDLGLGRKGQYSDASEIGVSNDQTIYVNATIEGPRQAPVIIPVWIFPETTKHLRLELPAKFKYHEDLQVEMDLKIDKFNRFREAATSGTRASLTVFIFVTPGKVRLLKAGQVVWSGSLTRDMAAIGKEEARAELSAWNQIKSNNALADFKSFLANFPRGANSTTARVRIEQLTWETLRASCDRAALENFLKEFPDGANAPSARAKIASLAPDPNATDLKPGSVRIATVLKNSPMCFAWIPPGSFIMGSAQKGSLHLSEHPQRRVMISEGFWMGQYEVLQNQYEEVTGTNPSYYDKTQPNLPVENVSWEDAKEFIRKLNELDKTFEYRLPSEAEWEYAARAGTTTAYAFGDTLPEDQVTRRHYPTVGKFAPNNWGLYDMHGNVAELTEDIYRENYEGIRTDGLPNLERAENDFGSVVRSVRGGSMESSAEYLQSASRSYAGESLRHFSIGFRIILKQKPRKN